jgi:hypothetical protein
MTVDEMLSEPRAMLTPRLPPAAAYGEMQQGALLVDIRNLEQRARDGEIPNAAMTPGIGNAPRLQGRTRSMGSAAG